MRRDPIKITGQVKSFAITKDGGGKLTIEFGADSLGEVKELMGLGDVNLAMAIVPYVEKMRDQKLSVGPGGEIPMDSDIPSDFQESLEPSPLDDP